jgi:hypothetical protein
VNERLLLSGFEVREDGKVVVLADEQCCLAGVPDDHEQSDVVVMSAGQYPGYGAH